MGCRNSQGEGKSLNLIFLDFFLIVLDVEK